MVIITVCVIENFQFILMIEKLQITSLKDDILKKKIRERKVEKKKKKTRATSKKMLGQRIYRLIFCHHPLLS